MNGIFDDFGIRFAYPLEWELDVQADGTRTTVTVQAPDGMAFAFVASDTARPSPKKNADEALAAMKAEYPDLESVPARETIDGHSATGHDLEFFSFDMVNSCAIRSLRTPRRTVLFFGQWSQLDEDQAEDQIRALRRSFEETDA